MLSSVARLHQRQSEYLTDHRRGRLHIEAFVPIRVECLLDDRGRSRLLSTNGRHGEWVRKSCFNMSLVSRPFVWSRFLLKTSLR